MNLAGFGKKAHSRRAFTLIEIMVVVGVLAIVLAMGVPPFIRMMRKDSLRQAVSDIEEACSKARAEAILHGVPTEVVLRAADGQVTVAPVPDSPTGKTVAGEESSEQPPADAASRSPIFSARLHQDIAVTLLYVNLKNRMEAEESRVHFYPNGTSDEFTIVLEGAQGVEKISLECVTGLASVEVLR